MAPVHQNINIDTDSFGKGIHAYKLTYKYVYIFASPCVIIFLFKIKDYMFHKI